MNPNDVIQQYLRKMKLIHENILQYLEKEDDENEDFQNLINYLDNQQINKKVYKLKAILNIISKIADHHYRYPILFDKIFKIIKNYKKTITKLIPKPDIFNIFSENKSIILFLFEEKIIEPNQKIANLFQTDEFKNKFFPHFFLNELNPFFDENYVKKINFETLKLFENREFKEIKSDTFEKKRKIGFNDEIICQIIREDSVEKLKYHLKKFHIPPSFVIKPFLFETNLFLTGKKVSLIEYAAFYGSFQIFKFLNENHIELTPQLWLFAIHGNNIDLIQYLEKNNVQPPNGSFENCLKEAIKCHHIDVANYIIENLLQNNVDEKNVFEMCLQFFDFAICPDSLDDTFDMFYNFCKYDYFEIVNSLLEIPEFDLKANGI